MKSNKGKKKKNRIAKKSPSIPEFNPSISDEAIIENLRLSKYGKKLGSQPDAIRLVEQITLWNEILPSALYVLRNAGYPESAIAEHEGNTKSRLDWFKYFENAIVANNVEFFEIIAELLRLKKIGSPHAHHAEYLTYKILFEHFQTNQQVREDGKGYVSPIPTKKQIAQAVEAKGITVTNWPRLLKRTKLKWFPKARRGKNLI